MNQESERDRVKEMIAAKHGIIHGHTLHSNPEIIKRNLYNAMEEYAKYYYNNDWIPKKK